MTIAYVEHPVTVAEKKELRKKFDKVVDIRFAPEKLEKGDKKIQKAKVSTEEKPET
jgi:hypothetical protein